MSSGKDDQAREGTVPKLQPLRKPRQVTALATTGLFVLAVFYTFYLAREFFLPVTLAWVLSLLLKPGIRLFERVHIPPPLGAALFLILLLGVLLTGLILLSAPATEWIRRLPASFDRVEMRIRSVANKAHKISEAAQSVERITETERDVPKVEIKQSRLLDTLWGNAKGFLVMMAEVLVLLYFFLAAGDVFMLKLIQILPRLKEKKRAIEMVRETERGISQYLLSMSLVNLFEGTVIGLGLGLLGLPNPLLWGVVAFFANYIPYLGAITAAGVITLVALVSFESVPHALLAPAIYIGVNFMDNFISPYVMGRRLVLNPVIVFLAVMFWGWIWGIPGVLLAVPLTMILKIVCDHNATLAPFAEFLTAPRRLAPVPEDEIGSALSEENA